MHWYTKGKVFSVNGQFGWMNSHSQVPTVLPLKDRYRVFYSTRIQQTESRIARVDISLDWKTVLSLSETPVLELGQPGTFDEHGNMPSAVFYHQGKVFLYYSGWSRRTDTPYANYTGLAISKDDGISFEKFSEGPVLTQDVYDPFSATSPCVFVENDTFHCFYCSGTGWIKHLGKFEHVYDIKYAYSKDGIHWQKRAQSILPQTYSEEAITRPTVCNIDGTYYMWFCARGTKDHRGGVDAYRIGQASSSDLINWQRSEDWVGLNRSELDGEMQAYPYVIMNEGKLSMLFNGNGFGQTGILLAECALT